MDPHAAVSPFKALATRQPWAALIAEGRKKIEYRTWKTDYRGPLVIIASGTRAAESDEYRTLHQPTSCLMAIVDLVDIESSGDGEFSWILANPRRLVQTRYTRSRVMTFNLEPDVVVKLAEPSHAELRPGWSDAERTASANKRSARAGARKPRARTTPATPRALPVAWVILDTKGATRGARARGKISFQVPAGPCAMEAGQPVFVIQADRTLSAVLDVTSVTRKGTVVITATAAWTSDAAIAASRAMKDARIDVELPAKGRFAPLALTMPEARRLADQLGHTLPENE